MSRVSPEWDADKAASNLRKHGVDFADAVNVLEDPRAVTIPDEATDEERFVTVGMDALGRVLVVCWTWRNDDLRFISARKANTHERAIYQEE